jgi:hypothetical protein
MNERPTNRHPLSHAARQLPWIFALELTEPYRADERPCPLPVRLALHAAHLELDEHVPQHRAPIQQQVILEDDADIGIGRQDRLPLDMRLAACRLDEPGNDRKQCTLAATARPEQRDELARANVEIDAVHRKRRRAIPRAEGFRNGVELDEGAVLAGRNAFHCAHHSGRDQDGLASTAHGCFTASFRLRRPSSLPRRARPAAAASQRFAPLGAEAHHTPHLRARPAVQSRRPRPGL